MLEFKTIFLLLSLVVIYSADSLAHDQHEVHDSGHSRNLSLIKGQRVVIDLLSLCRELVDDCSADQIVIKKQPAEGVLFEMQDNGKWAYQHAGTSVNSDTFKVMVIQQDKSDTSFSIIVEIDTERPKVTILEPSAGSFFTGGKIVVIYTTIGNGFDHIHLKINDQNHVSLYAREGKYVFTGVAPGTYSVSAELARADHRVIPDTLHSVEVRVVD